MEALATKTTKRIVAILLAAMVAFTGSAQARDLRERHDSGRSFDRPQIFLRNTPHRHDNRVFRRDGHPDAFTRNDRRGNFDDRGFYDRRFYDRRFYDDRHHGRFDRSFRQGDAYVGGLSAWSDSNNGIYFYRDGYDDDAVWRQQRRYDRTLPKIIRVTPGGGERHCSFESGVCVIRR